MERIVSKQIALIDILEKRLFLSLFEGMNKLTFLSSALQEQHTCFIVDHAIFSTNEKRLANDNNKYCHFYEALENKR
jgi:hypothetical protein